MKRYSVPLLIYTGIVVTCYWTGFLQFSLPNLLLIPTGIIISCLAMSSGIAGAAFWFPVYLLLNIDPKLASWIALCTMFFGFGSGLLKHYRQGTMSWHIIQRYLYAALLGGIIGSLIFSQINPYWLIIVFGIFLMLYGGKMFFLPPKIKEGNIWLSYILALFGGIMKGLISIGIEIIITDSLSSRHDHEKIVGSVVFVVFIVNLFVIITRLLVDNSLFTILHTQGTKVIDIMLLVVPSVIIGGQLGPLLTKKMSRSVLIRYISILLIIIGGLMLYKANLIQTTS